MNEATQPGNSQGWWSNGDQWQNPGMVVNTSFRVRIVQILEPSFTGGSSETLDE